MILRSNESNDVRLCNHRADNLSILLKISDIKLYASNSPHPMHAKIPVTRSSKVKDYSFCVT